MATKKDDSKEEVIKPGNISVPKYEYKFLKQKELFLLALEDSGLRDWSGRQQALELYEKLKSNLEGNKK